MSDSDRPSDAENLKTSNFVLGLLQDNSTNSQNQNAILPKAIRPVLGELCDFFWELPF
jgi:hypothetical protein